MSDVQTQESPAQNTRSGLNPQGDFIWYELMTSDPDGRRRFTMRSWVGTLNRNRPARWTIA